MTPPGPWTAPGRVRRSGRERHAARRYPTYVGLGVAKAGTTLLHSWLADHPEVCVPRALKEASFFDRHYHRGTDWYLGLFEPTSEVAVGEFSGTYLQSEQALSRIARDLPHARCLVSLRDPVARLDSEYRDALRLSGYPHDRRRFVSERPEAVGRGRYAARLESLLSKFPSERVKIFLFEEVVRDPPGAVRGLYGFVGVDPGHVPRTLEARLNPSREARWPRLDRIAHRAYELGSERDLRWLLRLGRSAPVRRVRSYNVRPGGSAGPEMEPELARELRETYARDIVATGRIVGRDLEELWRTGAD